MVSIAVRDQMDIGEELMSKLDGNQALVQAEHDSEGLQANTVRCSSVTTRPQLTLLCNLSPEGPPDFFYYEM